MRNRFFITALLLLYIFLCNPIWFQYCQSLHKSCACLPWSSWQDTWMTTPGSAWSLFLSTPKPQTYPDLGNGDEELNHILLVSEKKHNKQSHFIESSKQSIFCRTECIRMTRNTSWVFSEVTFHIHYWHGNIQCLSFHQHTILGNKIMTGTHCNFYCVLAAVGAPWKTWQCQGSQWKSRTATPSIYQFHKEPATSFRHLHAPAKLTPLPNMTSLHSVKNVSFFKPNNSI